MFESAELGHTIAKEAYKAEVPSLRAGLLDVQYELLEKKAFPVIVVIGGVDGAGKGETANVLNAWMDARHIRTHALEAPTDEERERPPMWRFWRELPPKGTMGLFFGSWYTDPIMGKALGTLKTAELDQATEFIKRFERMLANEGALLLKFWFHLSKVEQKKRLIKLEKRPKTRWRVTPQDWANFRRYDTFRSISDRVLRQTSTAEAPWTVVEGKDERYRTLTVARAVLAGIKGRLAETPAQRPPSTEPVHEPIDSRNVLTELDLTETLDKEAYAHDLARLQRKLNLLTRSPRFAKKSVVVVFEGTDAAGKGGAIRRITSALDARRYRVTPIAAPTEEERAQPYLWRFWRHLPRRGHIQIFDRSWYGRVLVERVEGFCSVPDWMRAYTEINDFEEQLAKNGIIIAKFWLHIDQNEQLARFQAREQTSFKRFKITDEDWRNREKSAVYERAICDMIDRTSTEIAPWRLVAANDKRLARIRVLEEVCSRIEAALRAKRLPTALVFGLVATLALGCKPDAPPEVKPDPAANAVAMARVLIDEGPHEGSVAAAVNAALSRAKTGKRRLVVYVGAHWCEPCMRFHRAAAAGELDTKFPDLTLLEFDLDKDRDRLIEAGYASTMIPLFAVPKADGTASEARMEGSIKGDGAVAEITPRLEALLEKAR